jgi:hypothetical protein
LCAESLGNTGRFSPFARQEFKTAIQLFPAALMQQNKVAYSHAMKSQTEPEVRFTRAEAADYIGVSRATLETWASTGGPGLNYHKPFGRVFYLKSELDEFLARNGGTSAAAIRGFRVKRARRIGTNDSTTTAGVGAAALA